MLACPQAVKSLVQSGIGAPFTAALVSMLARVVSSAGVARTQLSYYRLTMAVALAWKWEEEPEPRFWKKLVAVQVRGHGRGTAAGVPS